MHLTESGRLISLAIAAGMVLGMIGSTSAQFFNFGGFQQRPQPQRGGGGFGGGWFGNDAVAPFQQHAPQPRWNGQQPLQPVQGDFSRAPPPDKRNTVPERHILVLGDAMADWLAYGLEDACVAKLGRGWGPVKSLERLPAGRAPCSIGLGLLSLVSDHVRQRGFDEVTGISGFVSGPVANTRSEAVNRLRSRSLLRNTISVSIIESGLLRACPQER